ncbi:peptide chain release factor-like protein [Loktanella sp. DJP18]|uniref:peptide chain release factor-like protein n=1 Tax=Loktanella sp. DJP18 TaxID=3409788 RepID=UPI003BB515CC
MQAIRAGGPGGQHVNKTSSAIRAQWTDPKGKTYSVKVRDHRSQHQNRRAALLRLQLLAASDAQDEAADHKGDARAHHHHLERGNPKHTFEGPQFRPV